MSRMRLVVIALVAFLLGVCVGVVARDAANVPGIIRDVREDLARPAPVDPVIPHDGPPLPVVRPGVAVE